MFPKGGVQERGHGKDEIECDNEDKFIPDGKVEDMDEFLDGEEISIEEVTIDALMKEINEKCDEEEEFKKEEPTELPIDIPTHADMMQILKRIDTDSGPSILKEIRDHVRKTQRASTRQTPLLNFFKITDVCAS